MPINILLMIAVFILFLFLFFLRKKAKKKWERKNLIKKNVQQRNVRTVRGPLSLSLSLSRVETKKHQNTAQYVVTTVAYSTTVHSSTVDILIDGFIRPHD
jgi:archaellum biogenesis protein FlaJ (TadC family)